MCNLCLSFITNRIFARDCILGPFLDCAFENHFTLITPYMMGVLSLPLCSGALGPHLLLDQSRHLVTLSAPSSGPPTSLPLGSQSSAGGSSTLSKKRAPPPPPGHKRTHSDPPSPVLQGPQSKGASRWQHLSFCVCRNNTFFRKILVILLC